MRENIIFDLGGVLLDLDMNLVQEKFRKAGADASVFFDKSGAEGNATICNGLSASHLINDYQVGKMSTDEFVDIIKQHCDKRITTENIVDAWNACLVRLPEERIEKIKELRGRGAHTYLLSNTNDLHWKFVEREFLSSEGAHAEDLFDNVFLSHEMHMAKPNREIYREVLSRIGCRGEECMFIDDSMANTEAAREEGIHSEWLDLTREDVVGLLVRKGL